MELKLNNNLTFITMESNNNPRSESGHASEKICPNCKKWTHYTLQADDVCEHCGQLLSTYKQEKEERGERIKSTPLGLFTIEKTDVAFVKYGKYVANLGYAVFTAFVSFMVWLITFVAG